MYLLVLGRVLVTLLTCQDQRTHGHVIKHVCLEQSICTVHRRQTGDCRQSLELFQSLVHHPTLPLHVQVVDWALLDVRALLLNGELGGELGGDAVISPLASEH